MKVMMKVFAFFMLLILVVSCATTPPVLPEKYNLDGYLERVDQISTSRISGWEQVDNQSVTLRVDFQAIRNDYYLIVLRRPMDIRYSNVQIGIENTASKDRAYSTEGILSGMRDSSSHGHPGTDFLQAPSNIANIVAGHDRVVIETYAGTDYYVIERIYKLKGREQAEEIKERLRRS